VIDVRPPSLSVLQEVFGYPRFRGLQSQIVDHVVDGGDALVLMPTGGGKSLTLPGAGHRAPPRRARASRWWSAR
jgi:superfamily II DNA or RNA helicase